MTYDELIDRLPGATPAGTGHVACCPAHDDTTASLSIGVGDDGKLLLKCHAGCETVAITHGMGITMSALFPDRVQQNGKHRIVAEYDYRDADGAVAFQVCRMEPKDFRQRRPDGNGGFIWNMRGVVRCLYRLPELTAADPSQPVYIVEGDRDADRLTKLGIVATTNPGGASQRWLASYSNTLLCRDVVILPDNDTPGEKHAAKVVKALVGKAKTVRIVKLPGLPAKSDVSDWLDAGGTAEELTRLAGETEAMIMPGDWASTATSTGDGSDVLVRTEARDNDPADLARGFLCDECTTDGVCCLRYWRGQFWKWADGRYQPISSDDITANLWAYVDRGCSNVSQQFISTMRMGLSSLTLLSERTEQPAWLSDKTPFLADEVLATSTALIHLPSLADGISQSSIKPTPEFFSSSGTTVRYSPDAHDPVEWRKFLTSVWPDDPQQVETLQEWFGYLLTADTRQQKILLMIGPKRSGKGTVARVLRELIGKDNVAGPTLAGMATNFGLWPLIGRSLAIVSDARLSGRTDRAIVTERLLSVSGEDALTIDRKCLQPVTCRLPTRLMLMTNEVPRLSDASGALASRFIVLRMTRSFYGVEDHGLTDRLLKELPAILSWAIVGWQRLRDRGHFIQPQTSASIVADMEEITSPVSKFVGDWCVLDSQAAVSVPLLFDRWCEWCEAEKKRHGDRATFGRDLSAGLPELAKTQRREGGKRVWKYTGIRLRTTDDDVMEMESEYVHGQPSVTSGTSATGEDA